MSSTPGLPPRDRGSDIHRRETFRQIVLPFGGAVLLIVAMFLLAALLNDPLAQWRVAFIADFLFTLMVLCPLVLCLLPVYLLVVLAIYGMNRLHQSAGTPLQRLEHATENMAARIDTWTAELRQWIVNLSASFAPLAAVLSLFDTPEDNHAKSEQPAIPEQSTEPEQPAEPD